MHFKVRLVLKSDIIRNWWIDMNNSYFGLKLPNYLKQKYVTEENRELVKIKFRPEVSSS